MNVSSNPAGKEKKDPQQYTERYAKLGSQLVNADCGGQELNQRG